VADDLALFGALESLGMVMIDAGDARADSVLDESLLVARRLGHSGRIASALTAQANLAASRGDFDLAAAGFEEAARLSRADGYELFYLGLVLSNLGLVRVRSGAVEAGIPPLRESLALAKRNSQIDVAMYSLLVMAAAEPEANTQRATLLAAVVKTSDDFGLPLQPGERQFYEQLLDELREKLDPVDFEAAWERGSAMSLDDAIDFALAT